MKIVRYTAWIISILLVLAIAIIAGGYLYLRTTLPDYSKDTTAGGISDEITVIRDSFGMPHIYAATDEDACFALGYCMAQDRLFQMEMLRRLVKGQLAEIGGKGLVPVDRLFRTITAPKPMDDMFEAMSPEVASTMTAFAEGVNHYINNPDVHLPIEYSALGIRLEPWTPSDCLTGLYLMAWELNFSIKTTLAHTAVSNATSRAMADDIFIGYPPDGPTIIPDSLAFSSARELLDAVAQARQIVGAPLIGISNNWAVSGDKSITGKPLLANDMHLALIVPSVWYEAHLETPSLNVSGVAIPGTPLIVAGANKHVAWGFTNIMADDADLYMERINPYNKYQYEYDGKWVDMKVIHDTINVRGDSAVPFDIRLTDYGPIINDMSSPGSSVPYPLAMRWTLYDFFGEPESIHLLNRAKNVEDIELAAALFKCPGQNWVYADTAGNIGYIAAVGIPTRKGFTGARLLPGWDSKYQWSGYVPFDEQPQLQNPSRGWVASANNKPVGDNYPYYISDFYAPPYRYARIAEMLSDTARLSIEYFEKMQSDTYIRSVENWKPIIESALSGISLDSVHAMALYRFMDWDDFANTDESGPLIFFETYQAAVRNIFKERLGDSLYENFVGVNVFTVDKAMQHLIEQENSPWFDNPKTNRVETRDTIIAESFLEAVDSLSHKLGPDIDSWQWGRLHTVLMRNIISRQVPIVGGFMNIGPFDAPGANNSINAMIYSYAAPYHVVVGPSQRYIFDLGNINNSQRIITTGASGNFMSPYYDDQADMWIRGQYRPFILDRSMIEGKAAYTMEITPSSEDSTASGL